LVDALGLDPLIECLSRLNDFLLARCNAEASTARRWGFPDTGRPLATVASGPPPLESPWVAVVLTAIARPVIITPVKFTAIAQPVIIASPLSLAVVEWWAVIHVAPGVALASVTVIASVAPGVIFAAIALT
jgi:hypothetical protein